MRGAVIPSPWRCDHNAGELAFRSGTPIACRDSGVAPVVERFCSEVARRMGLCVLPMTGTPRPDVPSITVELTTADEFAALTAPLGVSPLGERRCDERHSLTIDAHRVLVRAAEPVGIARGLSTLIQLLAAATSTGAGEVALPGMRILDAPRYAWRGLSLDLARTFFTPDEVRRVIDLLALYKLNVLHLHLTDDHSWRLPVGQPAESSTSDATCYSAEELRALAAYAEERFVTVVPEVDTPGHASALLRMRAELDSGRNCATLELPPGHTQHAAWLDPELPATFAVIEQVLAGVAAIFPGAYIHIGGDEPRGMPHHLYASYVQRVRRLARALGRRPLGWQETARAGLGVDDVIQYWRSDIALAASASPEARAQMDDESAMSRRDIATAVAASVPVIASPLSHCYLDVPYAEPPADPGQAQRHGCLGLRLYASRTVAESFDWEPGEALGPGRAGQVAGVEAAIWAETIFDFDDLCFLLLPRLPGVAEKAWCEARATTWTDHRDRLARHGRLWAQDGFTFFRTCAVDWV